MTVGRSRERVVQGESSINAVKIITEWVTELRSRKNQEISTARALKGSTLKPKPRSGGALLRQSRVSRYDSWIVNPRDHRRTNESSGGGDVSFEPL